MKKLIYIAIAIVSILITISCGTAKVYMPNDLYKTQCKTQK